MIGISGKKIYPIGVDLGSNHVRLAQLGTNKQGVFLQAAGIAQRPQEIELNTPAWQHWAIDAIKQIARKEPFKGKSIITALPPDDLFIDPIKVPRATLDRLDEVVAPKVSKRLPFPAEDALMQHVVVEFKDDSGSDVDVLAIAAGRETVNRHLAIYEKAGLDVVGINVWPLAMISSFTHFFCRRQNEQDKVAILLSVGSNHSSIVIARSSELLFARVVGIGYQQFDQGQMVQRLFSEIDACVRYFETGSGHLPIERLLFFAGSGVSRVLCDKVAELAQRLQVPAQIGDVLCAVEINQGPDCLVDRRNSKVDWATTFGLSLSS